MHFFLTVPGVAQVRHSWSIIHAALKLVIAGAVVVLSAACSSQSATPNPATGGTTKSVEELEGAFDSSPGGTPPASQGPSDPAVRVGEAKRIGDLELAISQAKSASTAKKLFDGVYRAENRFLITPVVMAFITKATLTDSAGATYNIATDISSTQTVRATPTGFSWDINPSSKGKVVLVFDIPKDGDPVSIAVDGIATIQF